MEGRTIVRPDLPSYAQPRSYCPPFNGGPDNRPARHRLLQPVGITHGYLQWRAGQSSGQTALRLSGNERVIDLQWRAGQSSGQTLLPSMRAGTGEPPSMEGRTIVRPDGAFHRMGRAAVRPSMEGRTIVRPDHRRHCDGPRLRASFNGGPDNRPARPV